MSDTSMKLSRILYAPDFDLSKGVYGGSVIIGHNRTLPEGLIYEFKSEFVTGPESLNVCGLVLSYDIRYMRDSEYKWAKTIVNAFVGRVKNSVLATIINPEFEKALAHELRKEVNGFFLPNFNIAPEVDRVAMRCGPHLWDLPRPNRHHNLLHHVFTEDAQRAGTFSCLDSYLDSLNVGDREDGFLTIDGRFVCREEGLVLARINNQIVRRCGSDTIELTSENLW